MSRKPAKRHGQAPPHVHCEPPNVCVSGKHSRNWGRLRGMATIHDVLPLVLEHVDACTMRAVRAVCCYCWDAADEHARAKTAVLRRMFANSYKLRHFADIVVLDMCASTRRMFFDVDPGCARPIHFLMSKILHQESMLRVLSAPLTWACVTEIRVLRARLTEFPREIIALPNLTKLVLSYNELVSLPHVPWHALALQGLDLSFNKIEILPVALWSMPVLQKLYVQNNQLTEFHIPANSMPMLQELNLGTNRFATLHIATWNMPMLQKLWLTHTPLLLLNDVGWKMPMLQQLFLNSNRLIKLHSATWDMPKLQYLSVKSNQLGTLYINAWSTPALQTIKLRNNMITVLEIPIWPTLCWPKTDIPSIINAWPIGSAFVLCFLLLHRLLVYLLEQ